MYTLHTHTPVSYTHLDVYKRQAAWSRSRSSTSDSLSLSRCGKSFITRRRFLVMTLLGFKRL